MAQIKTPQSTVSARLGMNYKEIPLGTVCPRHQERHELTVFMVCMSVC